LAGRLIILHELAHLAQPFCTAGHGPEFAGIYLALVRRYIGVRRERSLTAAFERHGVRVQPFDGVPRHHIFATLEEGAFWDRMRSLYEQEHHHATCQSQ
jgi:hypothetical protein